MFLKYPLRHGHLHNCFPVRMRSNVSTLLAILPLDCVHGLTCCPRANICWLKAKERLLAPARKAPHARPTGCWLAQLFWGYMNPRGYPFLAGIREDDFRYLGKSDICCTVPSLTFGKISFIAQLIRLISASMILSLSVSGSNLRPRITVRALLMWWLTSAII